MNKPKGVLQYAGVGSPYRGNFICSLDALRAKLEGEGKTVVYLFPLRTAKRDWAQDLKRSMPVYFMSGNIFKDILLVRKIIKKYNIKIIHSHFFGSKQLIVCNAASLFRGVKHTVHIHCALKENDGVKGFLRSLILRNKVLIGCSSTVTAQAEKLYPKNKAVCIENAVFFERLEEYEAIDKAALGLDTDKKTLMMFGFLYEIKGVDLALEALNTLCEKGEKLQLILILTSNEESIRQKILQRFGGMPQWLHILPPRNDIASYYRLCDLFIAPSRSEGMPYSVLEVASLGIPEVLSDIPAHKNLNLKNAVYFESGNAEKLSEAIITALNPAEKLPLNEQAELIRKSYTLDEWTDRVLHIYEKL